jgi:hypothetical protein
MEGLMDHFVKLAKLPVGFEFPPDLMDRFTFDAEGRKLVYHGYMNKADFDRVCQLTKDWSFRRSLEELWRLCVPEEAPAPRRAHRYLNAFARLFSLG